MCIKNNYMTSYSGDITCDNHKPNNLSLREVPQFSGETEDGSEEVTTKCGYKRVHSLSIGDIFDDMT